MDRVWFQTDEAWDFLPAEHRADLPAIDVREEARGLRFITSARRIESFADRYAAQFRPFTLYGSGDFHHLSGVWTRQFTEPFHLLSFDNHPDWDIRPPRWSCGAWINRALENPRVQSVSIWGCGNFECNLPGRLLGNRAAALAGRLRVQPWQQEGKRYPAWLHPVTAETWCARFMAWVESIRGQKVYVTLDMDCLSADEVFTNWENGRFRCADIIWALAEVRKQAQVLGGDLCGAWSLPRFATKFQSFAGWFDHPALPSPPMSELAFRQTRAFDQLWPALTAAGAG